MAYLLKCDTCDKSYHFECLQPRVDVVDKPRSAWRCSFCIYYDYDTAASTKAEPFDKRQGGEKSSLKIKRYIMLINLILMLLPSSVVLNRNVGS